MSCALGHAVMESVGEMVGPAVKSILRTSVGTVALGIVLMVAAIWLAADGSWIRGLLAGLAVVVLCAIFGVFLVVKRAIGKATEYGVRKLGLGQRALHVVFDRVLGVSEKQQAGDRGGKAGQFAETLPLAQAEERLKGAIQSILRTPSTGGGLGGWLLRKVESRLFRVVQQMTLARFRHAGATSGGIDLIKIRDDLAGSIDARIADQIAAKLAFGTRLVLILMVVVSFLSAFLIRQISV